MFSKLSVYGVLMASVSSFPSILSLLTCCSALPSNGLGLGTKRENH